MGKKPASESGIVDAEVVAKLKNTLDLVKKETSKMLHILRQGKVKVEQNVMDVLEEIGSTLENEFENAKFEFEENKTDTYETDKKKNKKSHIPAMCARESPHLSLVNSAPSVALTPGTSFTLTMAQVGRMNENIVLI